MHGPKNDERGATPQAQEKIRVRLRNLFDWRWREKRDAFRSPETDRKRPVATYLCSGVHHSGMSFGMRSFRTSGPHWGSNSTATFRSAKVPNCIAILC